MAAVVIPFKHQSVRDLAWAISSPPLVLQPDQSCRWPDSRWYQCAYEESLPWFRKVDEDPSELEDMLDKQKDRRLGKVFETLWLYWFSHHPRYEVVENNLQIIVDGETLGEIDFIVFDKVSNQMVHWEVAVKFYLGVGDTSEMSNWYGPNRRDRLDLKVAHLLQRQSIVSRDPRVRHWLEQKNIDIDQCAVILKGRLYYPWNRLLAASVKNTERLKSEDCLKELNSPRQCCLNHQHSWWLKESQFHQEFDSEQCFVPLIKQGWMESIPTLNEQDVCDENHLFKMIFDKKLHLPLQFQVCNPCYGWDKAFLVQETWGEKIS